jgi:hypothetical protein
MSILHITSSVLWSREYLCQKGFVPFLLITIPSFPRVCLIIGFVTRVAQRVPLID